MASSNGNEPRKPRTVKTKAAPAQAPAPAKKAGAATTPAPGTSAARAKKAAPARKAAPAKKAAKGRARSGDDAPVPIEGTLFIGSDGRLSLRFGDNQCVALADLADLGGAQLTLQVDLKKTALLATGTQADLLRLLGEFLDERAKAGIFGGVTTCRPRR